MDVSFYIQSIFLGVGLAMDACAVSMSNGLKEPKMKLTKVLFISFMFGLFQGLMPLIGYLIGHSFVSYFEQFIPWIALILLLFLGVKMIIEATKNNKEENSLNIITINAILIQTIATSIDALSVGVTFADYNFIQAFVTSLIIALTTFIICVPAHYIGMKFGDIFENKAEIFGGIILIIIGIEIFISGVFF